VRRLHLVVATVAIACVLLTVLLAFFYYLQPTPLRVAVVRGSRDQAMMSAAAHILSQAHEPVRLKLVAAEDLRGASKLLGDGKADLAVLSSDTTMPPSGRTILIMRHNAVLIFAPNDKEIHKISDLAGKRIGILRPQPRFTAAEWLDNGHPEALLALVLAQYDVPAASVTKMRLTPAEIPEMVRQNQLDAILIVDAQEAPEVATAIDTLMRASGHPLIFLPVQEAEAIVKRMPNLDVVEVVRGVFGGADPPRPEEDFDTLGSTTRLVATTRLGNDLAGELTRVLLAAQPGLAAQFPIANQIQAPDSRKDAVLPVHPGTLAYLDDEEESFFDRYSDLFYIGIMALSLLGTGIATMMSRLRNNPLDGADEDLQKLLALVGRVRESRGGEELDLCRSEAEALFDRVMTPASIQVMGPVRLAAFGIAFDELRFVMLDKQPAVPMGERSPRAMYRLLNEALLPHKRGND